MATPIIWTLAVVLLSLIVLRTLQIVTAKSQNPIVGSIGQGLTYAMGH